MRFRQFLAMCFLGLGLFPLHAQEPKVTVMNPLGTPPSIRLVPMAPRLNALDGKTVFFVDARYVGGDIFLKEMMSWFSANMPKVKLEFRQKAGAYAESDPQLWDEIRQKGDAVVMAIGH
jgi:hypothetical protein